MIRTNTTLDQDRRTEGNCVRMYSVQCRVIVDNKCEFQHLSFVGDCNFDARLVSKTRKNQTVILRSVRMINTHTQKKKFTSRRV